MSINQCACGARTYGGSGGSCAKCAAGRTTPGVWTAAPLKAGASYAWKAPVAGYRFKSFFSSTTNEVVLLSTDEADVAACKKRCSAADCAGITWDALYKLCYICSDASKGSANGAFTTHPRTAVGAKTVTQCSFYDKGYYAKGTVYAKVLRVCTSCPTGRSSPAGATQCTICTVTATCCSGCTNGLNLVGTECKVTGVCVGNTYKAAGRCAPCPAEVGTPLQIVSALALLASVGAGIWFSSRFKGEDEVLDDLEETQKCGNR